MKQGKSGPVYRPVARIMKRHHYGIIALVIFLLAAVSGGAYGYVYYKDHHKKNTTLSEQQKRTKDTIAGQEQVIQEYREGSDLTKSALYGNMAKSYADTNQCDNARQSFQKAKALAPAETKLDIDQLEAYIKKVCP
jgi:hypothetical protein